MTPPAAASSGSGATMRSTPGSQRRTSRFTATAAIPASFRHDGNFCMDGLVYPDRTPHTGLNEFKNVQRPLRASFDRENRTLTLHNIMDFTDASSFARIRWVLERDGETVQQGKLSSPQPRRSRRTKAAALCCRCGFCRTAAASSGWKRCKAVRTVCFLQDTFWHRTSLTFLPRARKISACVSCAAFPARQSPQNLPADDERIVITGNSFRYEFDCLTGVFSSMTARQPFR